MTGVTDPKQPSLVDRLRPAVASFALAMAACSVQLTAPYNANVEKETADLQIDFLRFAAKMQGQAGTPAGFYSNHSSSYGDFAARMTVIRMRAENDTGGVACGQALQAAERTASPALKSIGPLAADTLAGAQESDTCITLLARLAEQNIDNLRRAHELACAPGRSPGPCERLFGSPPFFNVTSRQSSAPAINAVAISLNELLRQERSMRPAKS